MLDWDASQIEYLFECKFGPMESRATSIVRLIQSQMLDTIEFASVDDVWGYGIFGDENLKSLGVIRSERGMTVLDFGRMAANAKSESVVVHIKKPFPQEVRNQLVLLNLGKSPRIRGDKIAVSVEIMIDNASFWQGVFGSLSVRNISFTFTLNFPPELFMELLPGSFAEIIKKARKQLIAGNKDAITFFANVSKAFVKIQGKAAQDALTSMSVVEPDQRLEIVEVSPRLESVNVSGTEFPVTLPTSAVTRFKGRIEGPDVFVRGTLTIDISKLKAVIRGLVAEVERESAHLKIG